MTWKTFLAALAIFLAGGIAGAGMYAAFGPDATTTVEAGDTTTTSTPATTLPPSGATTAPPSTPAPAPTTSSATTYTIQKGDSLGKIAAQFGLTVAELAQANGITDPNKVQAGQVLQIPAPGTVVTTTVAAGASPSTSG